MARTTQELIEAVFSAASDALYREMDADSRNLSFNRAPSSPLEQVIGCGLYSFTYVFNAVAAAQQKPFTARYFDETGLALPDLKAASNLPALAMWRHVRVDQYTADFVMKYTERTSQFARWVAIECDGHDFHERTKEQAAHDRARDRHFQHIGLQILRFTGSEIWRDPAGVVNEIAGFVFRGGESG